MNERPQIFAFYSFKGGVGRTMALLNLAYALVSKGRNVLVLDMDLEAPGLSGFMHREKEFSGFPRNDLLDLLLWARQTAAQLPEDTLLDPSALPPLSDYTVSVLPEKLKELPHKYCELGRLDVIPIDETRNFYSRLAQVGVTGMDRETLVRVGSLLRSWLKGRRITLDVPDYYGPVPDSERVVPYDYVLIDSRTGITEVGGLCIGPLSDQLVVLCGLNDQNVEGTRQFLTEVGVLPSQLNATSPLGKPTLFVASPVPVGEMQTKTKRLTRLKEMLGPVAVEIPYHPQMALMETIFVRDYLDEELTARYRKLLERLLKTAGEADDGDFDPMLLTRFSAQKGLTEQSRKSLNKLLRMASVSAVGPMLFSVMNQFDLDTLTTDADFRLLDRICRANVNDDTSLQFTALSRWSEVLRDWSQRSPDQALASRRSEAGIERLTRIIEAPDASNETRAWSLLIRGFRLGQQNDTERQLSDYTAVIEMTDAPAEQKANALVIRGITFGQRKEIEQALADYTAVIEMTDAPAEQKANALDNRGWHYFETAMITEAIADSRQAVALNPASCNACGNLAIALLVDGQTAEALAAYDAALNLMDAPDLTTLDRELREAIEKHGPLPGADEARARIESRAASLPVPDTKAETVPNAASVDSSK